MSGLRHAKVSRDFARAISRAKFRTRNFARFRRGKLMSRNGIGQREVRSVVDALKRFAPEIEISQGAFRSSRNRTFCISHFENRTFRISHFAKPDTLRVPADQVSDCPRRQTLSESVWRRRQERHTCRFRATSFARNLRSPQGFQKIF